MPIELLSMIGGSTLGFVFRYLAEKRQDEKELFERALEANRQTTSNQDQASKRVPIDVGKGVRQLIVLTVLFGSIAAPFILPFFGVPTFVEVDAKNPEVLFGIVPETTRKFFVEVNGFLYSSENRQILLSIVGFYFGTSAAARKS
jgi:hypothetical protein